MCGIAAIFAFGTEWPIVDREELSKIQDQMRARGPDAAGQWLSEDGRVGLAHRRLSIIDLSERARQPMSSDDGNATIVYNGEIYNYRRLRAELIEKGYRFSTSSDTEVILNLYKEMGHAFVERLRGMFALALWDAKRKKLLLARDPFGIKPLYYTRQPGVVRIASQVKALLAGGHVSREPDPAGVTGLFLWGSVPEPYSAYRDISQLPAGSYAYVGEDGVGEPVIYWSPKRCYECAATSNGPQPDVAQIVRKVLRDSVGDHLEADVPVGVFLSAGIDSSVLAALASERSRAPVRSVTLAFDEFRGTPFDESVLAEQTARRYQTEHTTVAVSKQDFESALPHILESMDQPTIDGINTYFVAKAADQAGLRVALSGLGGDELFGGYPSFRNIPRAVRWLSLSGTPHWADRLFFALVGRLPIRHRQKIRGLLRMGSSFEGGYLLQRGVFMPWELSDVIVPDLLKPGLEAYDPLADARCKMAQGSAYARVATLEQSLYMRNQLLRDSDWAGMAHSVEIRLPLVDRSVSESLACEIQRNCNTRNPKRLLAASARPPLPDGVLRRAKTGFRLPMKQWIRASLPSDIPGRSWTQAWVRFCAAQFLDPHCFKDPLKSQGTVPSG